MSQTFSLFDMTEGALLAERYEVVRPLRQGGMSSAFEAIDRKSEGAGSACELQVFPAGLFEGEEQVASFAGALRTWQRIEHPSVLKVRELLGMGSNAFVLVTDKPVGRTLRSVLGDRERFEQGDVVTIGSQLLEGLSAIHEQGLVHGDIKPTTVHLAGTDPGERGGLHAMLVDGGITPGLWEAKELGEKTALIGTPYYAPVEQFGGGAPTVQTDVYNVATVLFELVTGVLPWKGTGMLEVFQAKLDREAPSMRRRAPEVEIDPELEKAIVGGLMADRADRYSTAREFLDRLAACAPA
jgi:serine/threonine-protein kinase